MKEILKLLFRTIYTWGYFLFVTLVFTVYYLRELDCWSSSFWRYAALILIFVFTVLAIIALSKLIGCIRDQFETNGLSRAYTTVALFGFTVLVGSYKWVAGCISQYAFSFCEY